MNTTELYKALLEANVSEETAKRAVEGLAFADNIATTTDLDGLKIVIAGLKIVITKLEAELKAALKEKATTTDIVILGIVIAGLGAFITRLEAELKDKLKEREIGLD